jgi:hypothetical protein
MAGRVSGGLISLDHLTADIAADMRSLTAKGRLLHKPVAMKVSATLNAELYRVEIDPLLGSQLAEGDAVPPAVVVVRHAAMLPDESAGVIDASDVIAASNGDWGKAILIVLPAPVPGGTSVPAAAVGDARFLAHVQRSAPHLFELATHTVEVIRTAGVDGRLEAARGGRWVNRPSNVFTLKAQPRAGNLQFTLYGNPGSYQAEEFLLQDQNGYSRGWVRSPEDADVLAVLARESQLRRAKR